MNSPYQNSENPDSQYSAEPNVPEPTVSEPYVAGNMCSVYDTSKIETVCRRERIDLQAYRRFRNAYFRKGWTIERALLEFDSEQRFRFQQRVRLRSLNKVRRLDSTVDGASKLVFKTEDGLAIESVILRILTGRTTLCVSTQVGCAANCSFCATAKMGMATSLRYEQILDQVVEANWQLSQEQRRVRNVVFMGMGEPFHNQENVSEAVDCLRSPRAFGLSERHILVSTVGVADAMVRFAERYPRVNLALSLHSANQSIREGIIPMARRYNLTTLRSALLEIQRIRQAPLMVEYIMLAGVNDRQQDLEDLDRYLRGLMVHINLIPYNQVDEVDHLRSSDRATRDNFASILKERGYEVTQRYSLGSDIEAACGQLIRQENREALKQIRRKSS